MRVIITDKEAIGLKWLQVALECMPGLSIAAQSSSGSEAAALIRQMNPDIGIVDVNLPERSAFETVQEARAVGCTTEFIFTTVDAQDAAQAFELNGADCLIKPLRFERLQLALERAKERVRARGSEQRFAALQRRLADLELRAVSGRSQYRSEIWVREGKELSRVAVADVDYFESAGDYVIVHVGKNTHILKESISSVESYLDPDEFIRIHRGFIINIKRVRNLRKRSVKSFAVVLANGSTLPVGPSYSELVLGSLDAKRWRQALSY